MKEEDITLPIELASDKFTLEEIGTLFVLMCLPVMDKNNNWAKNKNLEDNINRLIHRGIIEITKEDNGEFSLEINLTDN